MQRAFDPLCGAERLENGALFYKFEDSEVKIDESKVRSEYENLKKSNSSALEVNEEDPNELRIALIEEMSANAAFNADEFEAVLDKEFSVFKEGEKYSFVKDLKDAYSQSLESSAATRILDTIPDYVFWDIKTPHKKDLQRFMNPYNPFRQHYVSSFFDSREYEEYMERRNRKQNIRDGVSTYRRY